MILRYLIPSQIIRGYLPETEIFEKYQSLKLYFSITKAVKQGNLYMFDKLFAQGQSDLIKWGTWLVIERIRLLAVRQLFRKIWVIVNNSRISISILKRGVSVATQEDISSEHVCCLIVNLIDKGFMKGYLSHEKQTLVLSAKNPFPNLN